MSFLAPVWLAAAAVVGVGVLVAHLFATSIPPQEMLPTVRFVPEREQTTVLRTQRLTDIGLLLLRLLAVALVGVALAAPVMSREAPGRVVLVDLSRAAPGSVRDSAQAVARDGDVLVGFDSIARPLTRHAISSLSPSGARGSISAALVAAQRAIGFATTRRDSAELVIVSPFVREEVDSATASLLALWEGPVRLVRVAAREVDTNRAWEVRAPLDDPVSASLAGVPRDRGRVAARVVREAPTAADSTWAGETGGALVLWPVDPSRILLPRSAPDSQGGISTTAATLVAPFARQYEPREGRALVRWIDGAVAGTERPLGRGCVREVAVPVDAVGDVALRDNFRRIAMSLLEPCGGARDFGAAELPVRSERNRAVAPAQASVGRLPLWLAAFALAVLMAEQLLRSRRRMSP